MEESIQVPYIPVLPMYQRSGLKNVEEDWTGKSNTALRKKLQNRLNQRASRSRKRQRGQYTVSKTFSDRPSEATTELQEPLDNVEAMKLQLNYVSRPSKSNFQKWINLYLKRNVTSALDFKSFTLTPLPSDQKLLTLLRFNLVRAFAQIFQIIRVDTSQILFDISSPFNSPPTDFDPSNLPAALQPTDLQLKISHHPGVDCIPFPQFRKNLIQQGYKHPGEQFCIDMIEGVEDDSNYQNNTAKSGLNERTGLIVWSEPWLQQSWEVEESFAKKYAKFFTGCRELIDSTNYWRASRNEPPLALEVLEVLEVDEMEY